MICWLKANRRHNILMILKKCLKYFGGKSCTSMLTNVILEWGLASS